MLVLDTLRVGDGSQIDLLVVLHQNLRKGVQLVELGSGERDVPCGTFLFQPVLIYHSKFLSLLARQMHKNRLMMHRRQEFFKYICRPQLER